MITLKAEIELYCGDNKRQTSFLSGYRPIFDIVEGTKLSGMIKLLDREEFHPGDKGIVEIKFLVDSVDKGLEFNFYESNEPLGKGYVLEVYKE